jgi:dTDP-4-amino-4,6-dideoxygalactose transaminase
LEEIKLPDVPRYATNNAHMFFIVCKNHQQRASLITFLKSQGILSVFHYLSLNKSPYYKEKYTGEDLVMSDYYTNCLLRLPMYYELSVQEVDGICALIKDFFVTQKKMVVEQPS